MEKPRLTDELIEKLRSMLNRAISTLAPDARPGDAINFTVDQLRLIAGALGSVGLAREVEAYLEFEIKKWSNEPKRRKFADELLQVVRREIDILEFYVERNEPRKVPLPEQVMVVNANTGTVDKTIPIEEFMQQLRDYSASSVFKK
jgi:hypothetical protein